jgi:protein subunit release factor B
MTEKQLLFSITRKDFDVQTFRSGGPGGQHQNKTESGVRIIHRESGAVGESRSERSQLTNKRLALQRLVKSPKFKLWHAKKVHELSCGKSIKEMVDEAMLPKYLKVEVKNQEDKWVEYTDTQETEDNI